jgi:hypothetical protein
MHPVCQNFEDSNLLQTRRLGWCSRYPKPVCIRGARFFSRFRIFDRGNGTRLPTRRYGCRMCMFFGLKEAVCSKSSKNLRFAEMFWTWQSEVVIGAAFGKIINSMVNDVLMPPLRTPDPRCRFQRTVYQSVRHCLRNNGGGKGGGAPTLNYGIFLNTILEFSWSLSRSFSSFDGPTGCASHCRQRRVQRNAHSAGWPCRSMRLDARIAHRNSVRPLRYPHKWQVVATQKPPNMRHCTGSGSV